MAKKAADSTKAITEPLYFITNQYNLREILSGGFIGSRASFDDKYYKDLLEECPGRIPLFSLPIDPSLFQQVNAHDPGTSFTVVLQIDPAGLELDSSVQIKEGEKEICIVCAGAISLKSVPAIHFLSAENRSEFEVRSYSNMPTLRELHKVSPELAQNKVNATDVLQKLKKLPELKSPTADEFSMLDRISGATSLCIYRSEGKDQSKQLLKQLEPSSKQKRTADIPTWFYLGFKKIAKEELYKLTDINELVFAGSIFVLYSYSPNTVSQRQKILGEIKELIDSHPGIAEHKETLDRSFAKIERVLQLKDDFEPFRPGPGYDAIRGLLLFLMRPHHKELLDGNTSELNVGQPVLLTALAYSGIVIGRKGLDTEYRPPKTDQEIAGLVVEALNRIKDKPEKTGTKTPKVGTTKNQPATLMASSAIAVPARLVAASTLDWKTISEEVLNKKKDDPEFIGSAVWLCREKGWNDCVTTIFQWSVKDDFVVQSGKKNEVTLKLSGFPEIAYELDLERFKTNLK